jgi:flavin reductase (DIM6/NTAB) family NADH-FMN oxidoreductase RutF
VVRWSDMPKRLLKYKNYDVHSITTITTDGRKNANIATWVMQTAMGGTHLAVALYKPDYTIELVRESGLLNVNLLATDQTNLIRKLGQQSGRQVKSDPTVGRTKDKFKNLPYALDERGCPYLTEAIGYAQCQVLHTTDAGDHELFICKVLKQVVLNPDKTVLTNDFLKERKIVRG